MTTSYDGRSKNEAGDCGLSRRDAVKGAGALALATAASTTSSVAGRTALAQVPGTPGQVTTSDGVNLHYLEAGSGTPILMIPGWSQTAEQFKYQLSGLSDRYRVIAVDMRGHGESDKPEFGYKISRLAKDTHDLIQALDLDEVNILGHSMGIQNEFKALPRHCLTPPPRFATFGRRFGAIRLESRHSACGYQEQCDASDPREAIWELPGWHAVDARVFSPAQPLKYEFRPARAGAG